MNNIKDVDIKLIENILLCMDTYDLDGLSEIVDSMWNAPHEDTRASLSYLKCYLTHDYFKFVNFIISKTQYGQDFFRKYVGEDGSISEQYGTATSDILHECKKKYSGKTSFKRCDDTLIWSRTLDETK